MLKGMIVKIYPNQTQSQFIEQNIGNTRFVWNQMLNMWNTRYQNNPNLPTLKKYTLNNLLPTLKIEYPIFLNIQMFIHPIFEDTYCIALKDIFFN